MPIQHTRCVAHSGGGLSESVVIKPKPKFKRRLARCSTICAAERLHVTRERHDRLGFVVPPQLPLDGLSAETTSQAARFRIYDAEDHG